MQSSFALFKIVTSAEITEISGKQQLEELGHQTPNEVSQISWCLAVANCMEWED